MTRDYIAFTYGGLPKPSGDALADGEYLAEECCKKLPQDNPDKFPPKLLILLASPEFINYKNEDQYASELLKGIHGTFSHYDKKPSLIGSSVAGVFFDKKIHMEGALLICLASKLIDVKVSSGENAREDPTGAIKSLLTKLEFLNKPDSNSDRTAETSLNKQLIDPNPLANKIILTFMPGCKQEIDSNKFYPAQGLHNLLYDGVKSRIMITGGVSSANDITRKKDGYQFCEKKVLQDCVVAASIKTGTPIGIGLNDALVSTKAVLRVDDVSEEDERTIVRFGDSGCSALERLEEIGKKRWEVGSLFFAKMSSDDERTLDLPLQINVEGEVGLLRKVEVGNYFEVLRPKEDIFESFEDGIKYSKERVFVENHIASLLFICKSYSRFHNGELLNIETPISQIDTTYCPCIGAFLDGEIGVDKKGRSRLTNGSVSYLTFGDEMRERTPLYKGVSALAKLGPELLGHRKINYNSVEDAIKSALKIIDEAGFLGAMISLVLSNMNRDNQNKDQDYIIAQDAVGARFKKIVERTKRPIEGDDILALIAKDTNNKPRFIPNSSDPYANCDKQAIEESGIISQYVLPLKRLNGTVFGTLQIDLGNLKNVTEEDFQKSEKARVLRCFAEIIGAGLNRIASAIENKFMLLIDGALQEAMKATKIVDGVQKFIDKLKVPFGVELGHVWLTDVDNKYKAKTEQPLYLEAGFGKFIITEKKLGLKRQANEDTPVFLAYRQSGHHIINDLLNDPVWKRVGKKARNKELIDIQSYAAIRFGEKNNVLGVISFGSTKPWFFLKFHQDVLKVLANSLSFLIEHLKTKIHHDFLRAVSPDLKELNLNENLQDALDKVTKIFCKELNADFASLYLWDWEKKKYVLRSGVNWKNKNWIHAAGYENNVDWFGQKAENDFPVYEPDLFNYYKEKNYKYPGGKYAEHIFGQSLSKTFTVEAIGLPLQFGKDKFGVMTFYRQIKKNQPSGFETKDIDLLQEGAFQAAGWIKALLQRRNEISKENENNRRQEVIQALDPNEKIKFFEIEVCRKVLLTYKASEVAFYRIDSSKVEKKYAWQAGVHSDNKGEVIEYPTDNSSNYSEIIKQSLDTCAQDVQFNQYKLNEQNHSSPQDLKIEGLKDEVYIPLSSGNEFLAALVIRWKLNPDETFFPEVWLNKGFSRALGRTIGSRAHKHLLAMDNRKKDYAVDAVSTMAAQGVHDLRHNIGEINFLAENLKKGEGHIDQLLELTERARNNASKIIELGKDIISLSSEKTQLSKLISGTFEKENGLLKSRFRNLEIEIPSFIDNEDFVYVDPHYTKEALYNLFNNAIKSVYEKVKNDKMTADPKITIKILRENYREIKLIISDNGEGMTEEEKAKAKRGFWQKEDSQGQIRICFGVLLADRLLTIQGGSLNYEGEKGDGTDAVVILPLIKME